MQRLALIQQETKRLKEGNQALAIHTLTQLQDFAPPTLLALAGRQSIQQSTFAHLTVTNVPGPPHEMYLMGARLLELHPMVLVANMLTLNVAIQSLAGRLSIGLCADRDRVPDLDRMKDGISQSLNELKAAGGRVTEAAPA